MDCDYEIIETLPDGRRLLRCTHPDCGHEILSLYGPELTHTSCAAAAPPPPPTLDELLGHVHRSLGDAFTTNRGTWQQIAGRVTVCFSACPLGYFDPQAATCTQQGSACRYFRRWLERLTVGSCRGWQREESG